MANDIKIFENNEFGQIRVITHNSQPYFIAKDVALVLGYSNTNQAVIDHCKKVAKYDLPVNTGCIRNDGTFGTKTIEVNIIPESDIYRLIMRSKLESAEKFQDWVCEEVLPIIRSTGGYVQKDRAIDFVDNWLPQLDEFSRGVIASVLEESRRLKIENKDLATTIALQKEDVEFAKALQVSEDTIYIGDFAKLLNQQGLNIGRNELFGHMRKHNLVIKERGTVNTPTQKAMEMKLLELEEKVYYDNKGKEKISLTSRITPKGQKYLIKKMTKNNMQTEMFA